MSILKSLMRKVFLSQGIAARTLKRLLRPLRNSLVSFIGNLENSYDTSTPHQDPIALEKIEIGRIVYYVGCPDGESKRYRVFNLVDVYRNQGRAVDVIHFLDLEKYPFPKDLTTAIIFRAKFSIELQNFILEARRRNVDVIFDTDDLVFEPESLEYIGAVRKLDGPEKAWHLNEVSLIRRALLMCDAATTSNDFLGSRIRNLSIRAGIVRFCLNPLQLDFARTLNWKTRESVNTRLGFFSGSPTHQSDFEVIEKKLFKFLEKNSHVVFVIVGYLELDDKWKILSDQVERHPFVPPLEMLDLMTGIDCLLVPLEMNNPFTNSKAEVKIFESALVSTPVICSAIYSYAKCIKSGLNGILITDDSEWEAALDSTLDREFLRRLGLQAKSDFVSYFNDVKASEDAITFYQDVRMIRLTGQPLQLEIKMDS